MLYHLAFALLAVTAVTANEEEPKRKVCVPGARRQMDCNTCICNEDGSKEFCTLLRCPPKFEGDYTNVRQRRSEPERKVCVPGARRKMDCNTCICNDDGSKEFCTLLRCPPKFEGDYTNVRQRRSEPEQKVCVPGTQRKMDCNTCYCNEKGTHESCTFAKCPPKFEGDNISIRQKRSKSVQKVCVPGTERKMDCNTCYCNEEGTHEACTFAKCPPKIDDQPKIELQKREAPSAVDLPENLLGSSNCQAGDAVRVGWHACRCIRVGAHENKWDCTLLNNNYERRN